MKLYRIVSALALSLLASAAHAQQGTNVPPGQLAPTQGINQSYYLGNTDAVGFSEQSESYPIGAGTTQATATPIATRVNVATCASGSGVILPAVNRYVAIMILNRGSAACLIYPSLGGYLETAAGTLAAVNVSYSLAAGADVTFRPAIVNAQTEWLQ